MLGFNSFWFDYQEQTAKTWKQYSGFNSFWFDYQQMLETLQIGLVIVSIPFGSIISPTTGSTYKNRTKFQFLLVRLLVPAHSFVAWCYFVSIPFGSIIRFYHHRLIFKYYVSIPFGSIIRVTATTNANDAATCFNSFWFDYQDIIGGYMTLRRAFQFLLVRLLVKEASNIHDIIGFQFLLVRLLDRVEGLKILQTVVSIPFGSIIRSKSS